MNKVVWVFASLLLFSLASGCRKDQQEDNAGLGGTQFSEEAPTGETQSAARPRKRISSFENQPVIYDKLEPNHFAILAGRFKDRSRAIQRFRELRQQRINNYIYEAEPGTFLVLIGHFYSRSQAERKLAYLQKRNFKDLEIYSSGNE
ncbi:MAG: hypothetical protein D6814_18330 [Calditrichaeota bacterium]|nr:MAG: hypothetical protein D6814_18330 [Calditrichota bacterium]